MAASLACSVQAGKDLVKEGKERERYSLRVFSCNQLMACTYHFFCLVVEFFYCGAAIRADMSKKAKLG